MFTEIERRYRDGQLGGRKLPDLCGRLHSTEYKGVRVLDLWPLEWLDTLTPGHGLQPLARLWRYELCSVVAFGQMLLWGLEKVGHGDRVRWYGQTWEARWLPESVLDVKAKPLLGPLPVMVTGNYPAPPDPDNPFG